MKFVASVFDTIKILCSVRFNCEIKPLETTSPHIFQEELPPALQSVNSAVISTTASARSNSHNPYTPTIISSTIIGNIIVIENIIVKIYVSNTAAIIIKAADTIHTVEEI